MSNDPQFRKAQVRAQFNTVAPEYDAGPGCFAHFGRRLVTVSNLGPGQHVLDVASGRGAVLFPAAEAVGPTGKVVGIDLAQEMARTTNDEAARRGLNAQVQVMDAEYIDFPNEAFDRVLCGFGIMFFPDQDRALAEFKRVLKPGGQIGISTWRSSQTTEMNSALADSGMRQPRQPGWITESKDLSEMLIRAGFTDVSVDMDTQLFRYSNVDEYWSAARGTGMRGVLDALGAVEREQVHTALAKRLRSHQRSDGIYLQATALLATARL